jgi:NADH:ubiquinone oxidoreductase subunit E
MEVEQMTTIQVCIGSACHLKGSYNVISKLQNIIKEKKLENQITIKAAFCLGECTKAVSVKVNDGAVQSLDEESVIGFLDKLLAGEGA